MRRSIWSGWGPSRRWKPPAAGASAPARPPPQPAAPPLRRVLTARPPALARWRRPMEVRTDTVRGFFTLWAMARLRPFRRWSHRFADERALIGRWLEAVRAAAPRDYDLALEIALCAR